MNPASKCFPPLPPLSSAKTDSSVVSSATPLTPALTALSAIATTPSSNRLLAMEEKATEKKQLIEELLQLSEAKTDENEVAYSFYEIVMELISANLSDVETIVKKFITSQKFYAEPDVSLSTRKGHQIYNGGDSLLHVFCRVEHLFVDALSQSLDEKTQKVLSKIHSHYLTQFLKFIHLCKREDYLFSIEYEMHKNARGKTYESLHLGLFLEDLYGKIGIKIDIDSVRDFIEKFLKFFSPAITLKQLALKQIALKFFRNFHFVKEKANFEYRFSPYEFGFNISVKSGDSIYAVLDNFINLNLSFDEVKKLILRQNEEEGVSEEIDDKKLEKQIEDLRISKENLMDYLKKEIVHNPPFYNKSVIDALALDSLINKQRRRETIWCENDSYLMIINPATTTFNQSKFFYYIERILEETINLKSQSLPREKSYDEIFTGLVDFFSTLRIKDPIRIRYEFDELKFIWMTLKKDDTIFSIIYQLLEKVQDQASKDKLLLTAASLINEMEKKEKNDVLREILQTAEPLKLLLESQCSSSKKRKREEFEQG